LNIGKCTGEGKFRVVEDTNTVEIWEHVNSHRLVNSRVYQGFMSYISRLSVCSGDLCGVSKPTTY